MQDNKRWYWEQTQQQNNIIVPKRTIEHPCLYVMAVTDVKKKLIVYATETNHTSI